MLNHWIRNQHIGVIELHHTLSRNALSRKMLHELQATINQLENNPEIKVVTIQASGPAFCSGHDLKELQKLQTDRNLSGLKSLFEQCSHVMQAISNSTKPYIAKVDGVATAAGCQLVATCDLAYASPTSRFATPGVSLGLFCSTPGVALGRAVGRKKSMEMLLTGDMISAPTAESIGLINEVVEPDLLDSRVEDVENKIASKSSEAIAIGKKIFYEQLEMPLEEAYAKASQAMTENMMKGDCQEGIQAFLTKQTPSWGK